MVCSKCGSNVVEVYDFKNFKLRCMNCKAEITNPELVKQIAEQLHTKVLEDQLLKRGG